MINKRPLVFKSPATEVAKVASFNSSEADLIDLTFSAPSHMFIKTSSTLLKLETVLTLLTSSKDGVAYLSLGRLPFKAKLLADPLKVGRESIVL